MIKNFKRGKVYVRFKNNLLTADLVEIGSFSFKNRGIYEVG